MAVWEQTPDNRLREQTLFDDTFYSTLHMICWYADMSLAWAGQNSVSILQLPQLLKMQVKILNIFLPQ